jgi:hypothetical protein
MENRPTDALKSPAEVPFAVAEIMDATNVTLVGATPATAMSGVG